MATSPPPTIPTSYPFWLQSISNFTNSLLIPVGIYVYSITCPLTLIKSLATILNLLTNSYYLLDLVLALIADNFPPSFPLATPGGTFRKLTSDAVFVVCSQTFTFFRLRKMAVPVEISRYSFHMFVCASPSVISLIPGKSFHFPFP